MTASQRADWFPAAPIRFLILIPILSLTTSYTEIRSHLLGLYIVIDSVEMNRGVKRTWNELLWTSLRNCPWIFPEELRKTRKHLSISGISVQKWTGHQLNTSQNHRSLRQRIWYSSIILNIILNTFHYNDRWSHAQKCLPSYLLFDLMTLLDCRTTGPRLGKIWKANLDAIEDISIYVGTLRIHLTLNIPSLARQRCLSSWGPRRTPWFFFCNFSTVWCSRLLKLCFFGFLKL